MGRWCKDAAASMIDTMLRVPVGCLAATLPLCGCSEWGALIGQLGVAVSPAGVVGMTRFPLKATPVGYFLEAEIVAIGGSDGATRLDRHREDRIRERRLKEKLLSKKRNRDRRREQERTRREGLKRVTLELKLKLDEGGTLSGDDNEGARTGISDEEAEVSDEDNSEDEEDEDRSEGEEPQTSDEELRKQNRQRRKEKGKRVQAGKIVKKVVLEAKKAGREVLREAQNHKCCLAVAVTKSGAADGDATVDDVRGSQSQDAEAAVRKSKGKNTRMNTICSSSSSWMDRGIGCQRRRSIFLLYFLPASENKYKEG